MPYDSYRDSIERCLAPMRDDKMCWRRKGHKHQHWSRESVERNNRTIQASYQGDSSVRERRKAYARDVRGRYVDTVKAKASFWQARAADYKLALGCEHCGFGLDGTYEQSVALHFDHIDRRAKQFTVSQFKSRAIHAANIALFDAEISKCRVLCANCHAMKGYREGDSRPLA